jgi:hypothetical protein
MVKVVAALVVCAWLSAGCGAGAQLRARSNAERWTRVETPHFSLSTNLDGVAALELARSLEETRAALLALAWTGGRDPRGRTPVVVFARPTDFHHYVDAPTLSGMAIGNAGFERLLSFYPGGRTGVPPVVVHELVHELSQWFMPVQPPWFAEGLAEYLDTLRYDRVAQRATIGEGSDDNLRWLLASGVFMRSSKLFATRPLDNADPREQASFYASSWLLVHYLLDREGEAFGQFQLGLTRLVPWQQAWQAAFPGLDPDALDSKVLAFFKENSTRLVTRNVEVPSFESRQRLLTEAEVHGVLAVLSSRLGLPLAERESLEALRLDPNELNALSVRFHALAPSQTSERLALARRAVEAHAQSGEAWLLLARAEPDVAARAGALRRAARMIPDHPLVARLLAEAALDVDRPGAALASTNLALRRSPLTPDLLALHVAALAAHGRCDAARALTLDADTLFANGCSIRRVSGGHEVACGQFVRDAWEKLASTCTGASAARLSPTR